MSDRFFDGRKSERQKKKEDLYVYLVVVAILAAALGIRFVIPEVGNALSLAILFASFAGYGVVGAVRARINFAGVCVQGLAAVIASIALALIMGALALVFLFAPGYGVVRQLFGFDPMSVMLRLT